MTDKSQIIAQTLNINTPAIQTDATALEENLERGGWTDIKFRIDNVSDSNTVCEGAFEYILIND